MDVVVTILLFVAFYQTRITNLRRAVRYMTLQSALLAAFCIILAVYKNSGEHIYIAGILTFIVKVLIIPYGLFKLVDESNEVDRISSRKLNYSSLACVAVLIMSSQLVDGVLPNLINKQIVPAAIFLIFTGLIIIVARSQAIMQIVGLITVENGIYMLGVSITSGLPLIIELGIFLDVLIAVVVLVILTKRMRLAVKTSDTAVLRKLRG